MLLYNQISFYVDLEMSLFTLIKTNAKRKLKTGKN